MKELLEIKDIIKAVIDNSNKELQKHDIKDNDYAYYMGQYNLALALYNYIMELMDDYITEMELNSEGVKA